MTTDIVSKHFTSDDGDTDEHVVVFRLGDANYAIDIRAVQEIVRMQAVTPLPGADAWMRGITNLRGRVVPVMDLRVRCDIEPQDANGETRIIVVASDQGMVGMMVDSVSEVIRIPPDQIEPAHDMLALSSSSYIRGVAKLDDRLVSLMDLEAVVPRTAYSGAPATDLPQAA